VRIFATCALLALLTIAGGPGALNEHVGPLMALSRQPADALLCEVEDRYAAVRSYEDDGIVITRFHGKHDHETRKPFLTLFSRSGLFRYEFSSGDEHYVVWQEPRCVRSWWTIGDEHQSFPTIAAALAGPTGVSGGSAHTIPTLLLGRAGGGWKITDLKSPAIIGEQELPGCERCTVIEGQHPRASLLVRLWIDPATDAIVRVERRRKLDDGTQVTETALYQPVFDTTIDPAATRFSPPNGSSANGPCN
jgi:hypothetical protein